MPAVAPQRIPVADQAELSEAPMAAMLVQDAKLAGAGAKDDEVLAEQLVAKGRS